VEIDLKRQIVQFWKDGRLLRVIAVSTGNGSHYCVPADKGGGCDTAITPGGSYRADRKIQGVRVSALGTLYDPVYFYGGIALHGSPSIPATPASHGCVRVPMWESGWVYDNVNVGDPVYVVGGATAPVPFGESAPVEAADEVTAPPAAA
jgi:lipoprotein-anchoring transpeptidase ErfK/SrfK